MNERGLVVDLFAGGGGASCGIEAALGRPIDVAINHSPIALAVHAANHPHTLHLTESVWKSKPLDVTKGRRVSLLWGSPDCFPAGTLVLTRDGLRSIENVREGEQVLTHRGRWRSVTHIMSKEDETVEVRGHGHYGLVTTAKHPFYSKHVTKRYPTRTKENGKRVGLQRILAENPYWPEASAMVGKLWATPRLFPETSIPICLGAEFSEDFFYFVGRWIGDDSINKGDVEICCGTKELDEFSEIMKARTLKNAAGDTVPFRIVDHDTSKLLVWGNIRLVEWLRANFGDSCESKRLPTWCLSMQANWRTALLDGYVDADGHVGIRTETTSVSRSITLGVRMLLASLGHAASMYKTAGRVGQIEGRAFVGRDAYCVRWSEKLQHETVLWDKLHMFTPVREVTPTGLRQTVYCLSVEEDESFVAEGIVVHNCTHHSNAKGGKPRSRKLRSLAWVLVRWAKEVRPDTIAVENVVEFEGWGPLLPNGKPCKKRKGKTFRAWVSKLRSYGYVVEWRVLDASLYGAPTKRRRLFIVARCDGEAITWPQPTHGPGRGPLRTAADCIDWSLPSPSIFERKKPLAEKTLWRIAQGLRRFVFDCGRPFIIKVNHGDKPGVNREARGESLDEPLSTVTAAQRGHALAVPVLQQSGYGERKDQKARVLQLDLPLGTLMATGQKHALVMAFLAKHFGDPTDNKRAPIYGPDLREPLGTVTARDHHSIQAVTLAKFRGTDPSQPGSASVEQPLPTISAGGIHVGEVRAFLSAYYGSDGTGGQQLTAPMRTLTAKHRLGLVTVEGTEYQIVDIGFRMLEPHELLAAQFGRFASTYDLSRAKTKKDKVFLIGNSVCPEVAEALIRANFGQRERAAA